MEIQDLFCCLFDKKQVSSASSHKAAPLEEANRDDCCGTWHAVAAIVAAVALFLFAGIAEAFAVVFPLGALVVSSLCVIGGLGLCLYALFSVVCSDTVWNDSPSFSSSGRSLYYVPNRSYYGSSARIYSRRDRYSGSARSRSSYGRPNSANAGAHKSNQSGYGNKRPDSKPHAPRSNQSGYGMPYAL